MVHSWIKETSLAALNRSRLCREQSSGSKHGQASSNDIFCAYYRHPHKDQRKASSTPRVSVSEKTAICPWVWGDRILDVAVPC